MAFLADTNVLVYRCDPRDRHKQRAAEKLLRNGLISRSCKIAHQAIVEFVAATTRPLAKAGGSLLTIDEARREAEALLNMFDVLYPNDAVLRLAMRGSAAYRLSWFDAHMWAYAEFYGLRELYSEDFNDGQTYGSVRVVNPF